jgi:hypothetical protein
VSGSAAVGKTALAVHWAHRAREQFPDGQLYVDLRGYGPEQPVSPDDALASWLRSLGIDGSAIADDLAERSARLRSLLDGHRVLLVIDNARSVEHARPLLPGGGECRVVVTSRNQLTGLVAREGARRIDVDRMTDDEGLWPRLSPWAGRWAGGPWWGWRGPCTPHPLSAPPYWRAGAAWGGAGIS